MSKETITITATYGDKFLTTTWDRERGCVGSEGDSSGLNPACKALIKGFIDDCHIDVNKWLDSVEWVRETHDPEHPYDYTKDDLTLAWETSDEPPLTVSAIRHTHTSD